MSANAISDRALPLTPDRARRHSATGRIPGATPEFALGRNQPVWEITWVAVVLCAILFSVPLGPLTPLTIIAALPAFALLRWETLWPLARSAWPLLLLPLLALASTAWSDIPAHTLRYATIYLLTVFAGMIMGGAIKPINFLKGMFVGFAIYGLMSFLSFRWVPWDGPGGQAFAGLAGSKNSAGDVAALSLITYAAMAAWGFASRRFAWLALALLSVPIALFILYFSKATGALIACLLASMCLALWLLSRAFPLQVRGGIFVLTAGGVALAVIFQGYWLPAVFDIVLAESGKSADLTGRVDLWRKSDELIAAQPWFGLGYDAFWVHNNLDAEYLWRLMGIESRQGFNFHSTPREILVHLGIVGLVLFSLVALVGALRLLGRTLVRPAIAYIYMCALLIFLLPKLPFEVVGFGTMHFATILLFAILSAGFQRGEGKGAVSARPVRRRAGVT